MRTKELFGGALIAVGLCAGAQAQSFIHGSQAYGNYVGAFWGGYRPFAINGNWNESETSGTASALSKGDEDCIRGYADAGNTGLAYAIHFSPISLNVTGDTTVNASWDFSGHVDPFGQFIPSEIYLYDLTNNMYLVSAQHYSNPVGSVDVTLFASNQYIWWGTALATDGESWYRICIPSPAGASLLGFAGLVAMRRRR
ncbi:MAG: VPLPA-CTERM sorting domain-containing protein [Phycisphaeraceae bacterium]|nr:VPLPA-CTERM sorting domain-containing protein [Phycisphaeraceae bacterium]